MPLYDYQCDLCGPFKELRPLRDWTKDTACPRCGSAGKRTMARPGLQRMSRNARIAHERNERSAHEPRVMQRAELDAAHGNIATHRHHPGRNMYRSSVLGHVH